MGLNDSLPYKIAATCEKLRPISSNIWDHHCLQLRRCLVGSPGCRVEALQRFKFPQLCGLWRGHLEWKISRASVTGKQLGALLWTCRSQREHTALLDLSAGMKFHPFRFDPCVLVSGGRVQSWAGGWMLLHRSWWNGAVILELSAKKITGKRSCLGLFFPEKKSHWAILSTGAANHIFSTLK